MGFAFQQILADGDPTFGSFVKSRAVARDGNYIAVGDITLSQVFVYYFSSGSWTLQQTINDPSPYPGTNTFGLGVVLSGDTLVVSAPTDAYDENEGGGELPHAGAAYVFRRSGIVWSLEQKLVSPNRGADYFFSADVSLGGAAISIDGDTIVIAQPFPGLD